MTTDLSDAATKYLASQVENRKRWLARMHALCEKVSYETPKEAQRALSTVREKSTDIRVPIRFYKCDRCKLYHLTSWPAPDTSQRNF